MAVSENDLVVGPLTPAAGVTTISLDFYFEQASWLEVYKAGSETPLVLNTDYTVAGAGSSSGVVTLTTAANGTDAYSIYLAVPLQRSSDMQLRGEFKSGPFNVEMDRLWQSLQGIRTLLQRSVSLPKASTETAPLLPSKEVGKALAWGEDGNLVSAPITVGDIADDLAASEAAREGAEAAELGAQTAQAGAEAAELGAQTAEAGAEAARDAAFINAEVYADEATGRAAVADGGQFQVVSGDEIIRYERVDASTSTEVARYPAASAVDPLQRTNLSIFAVEDADGNLGLDVRSPFRINEGGGIETAALLEVSEPRKWLWAVSDLDGNIPIGIDHLGRLVADFSLVPTGQTAFKTGGAYDYTVNHVFCYGQSLSVGQALPIQSGTAKFDHLMFTRGMRPQYDYPAETAAQWYAGLVPAVEAVSPENASLGETPSRGTGDAIKELIEAEDGKSFTDHEYRLLLSNPGFGALTIASLSKGSTHFSRMVEQAGFGLSLANAQGDTYAVQAVTWIQGESDYISNTPQATYLSSLNTLVSDIQTDLKSVTGQEKPVAVIGYQIATHFKYAADNIPDIALAQLECSEANPNFYIATAMYHFPYSDGGHLTGPGSQWLGAYLGLAYKRIVIDGENWSPVRPISSVRQGNIAEVRFHVPKGRLTLDTVGVPDQPNKGFQLVDSGGSTLTISGVEVVDFDRVRITAAASIPAGAKLRYAWQGDGVSRGLGNLRDTQGDTTIFDPAGVARPLHNWCVIFERSL